MSVAWRLMSGPPATAAETLAVDAALLDRATSPVLRLWNLSETAKMVGANAATVETGAVRRPTGGGTFTVEPQATGLSVVLTGVKDGADEFDRVACAVAVLLERFGILAEFEDPDKLQADGKRLGWIGGAGAGTNVLVEAVITSAPEDFGAGVVEAFSEFFDAEIEEGGLTEDEKAAVTAARPEPAPPPREGVSGDLPTSGGMLRATIVPGDVPKQIRAARFTGTFNSFPREFLPGLEASVAGKSIDDAPTLIEEFYRKTPGGVARVEPGEFLAVMSLAHMKVRRAASS
jgi:lipoate-protein ligase A